MAPQPSPLVPWAVKYVPDTAEAYLLSVFRSTLSPQRLLIHPLPRGQGVGRALASLRARSESWYPAPSPLLRAIGSLPSFERSLRPAAGSAKAESLPWHQLPPAGPVVVDDQWPVIGGVTPENALLLQDR